MSSNYHCIYAFATITIGHANFAKLDWEAICIY